MDCLWIRYQPPFEFPILPRNRAWSSSLMDYLSEGLSEEITNSPSRLPDLQVRARSIVSRYKAREVDSQGLGTDLHVDAILTGCVGQHGNEGDVESELVDVSTRSALGRTVRSQHK